MADQRAPLFMVVFRVVLPTCTLSHINLLPSTNYVGYRPREAAPPPLDPAAVFGQCLPRCPRVVLPCSFLELELDVVYCDTLQAHLAWCGRGVKVQVTAVSASHGALTCGVLSVLCSTTR